MIHVFLVKVTWLDIFLYINILLVLSVIFLSRKNISTTWAWIMIMLSIPIVGFVLYCFIGQDLRKRKTFSKKEEEDRFLAVVHRQQTSLAYPINEFNNALIKTYENLISLHLNAHEALYTEDNSINIITDGKELFNMLFESINSAKKYIHIEYYIIRNDELGKAFKNLLIKKAQEGVEVFLLYDDMGCFGIPKKYFYELKNAGVKVACFFPSFIPFIKLRVNYRNHRKICVIDGVTAYLGGFNIGEEYVGLNKKLGYWRDTHLKITGSAVRLIDLQFLLDRRFATNENISLDKYIPIETNNAPGNIGMQIVSSGPDSKHASVRNGYIKMIHEAKKSIYIQTPYFIPDEGVLMAIKLAALSGIDVRIMIPNKPDHVCVYWATYAYIGEVLDCGVRCYTYEKGFLHAKTIVIDDTICSVGTANFDIRSFKLNFEINAFIYDTSASKELSRVFRSDLKDCKELTPAIYKSRSLLIKFKESISRLISPIL
ncbi:cardiolipin synthase [Cellulosilyticum sp. I15G10I2]|uniref:cardiolipin synthase n=1 Tax=Cellulosilyticum sp. I15G10I2 TaxID=1892843 RepID=UPI00085BD243|nr:cardiolipin synthase [Cellulosilyticum sp. I15G10I2]